MMRMQKRPLHFKQGRATAAASPRSSDHNSSHSRVENWEDTFWRSMDCYIGGERPRRGPSRPPGGEDEWEPDWMWRVHYTHDPDANAHGGSWRLHAGASATGGARMRSAERPLEQPPLGQRCELSVEERQHLASLDLQALPLSLQELKAAYQAAAKRYHPDMVSSKASCPQRFHGVSRAFDFLKERLSE